MNQIDRTLFCVSYGLYLITANDGEKDCGCIINTFSQVTAENPLVSFAINKNNYTYLAVKHTKRFGISILSKEGDPKLIGKFGFFSSKNTDKFKDFTKINKWGIPFVLNKCCGYLACDLVKFIDAKSHVVAIAQTTDGIAANNFTPLTYKYYHENLKGMASKYAPTYNSNFLIKEGNNMAEKESYVCTVCGYVYEGNLDNEPDDYVCPICGASKDAFEKQ